MNLKIVFNSTPHFPNVLNPLSALLAHARVHIILYHGLPSASAPVVNTFTLAIFFLIPSLVSRWLTSSHATPKLLSMRYAGGYPFEVEPQ